jgi:hypothetical protein
MMEAGVKWRKTATPLYPAISPKKIDRININSGSEHFLVQIRGQSIFFRRRKIRRRSIDSATAQTHVLWPTNQAYPPINCSKKCSDPEFML